jgi:hypothetical protein
MNYQPQYRRTGMLSDLAPQEQGDLSQLLMYTDQPEYTQQPMMLAQNNYQPMGMQRSGLTASGDYPAQQAPAAPAAPGYNLGKDDATSIGVKQRILDRPINRNDPMWKMLRSDWSKESDDKIDARYRAMQPRTP